SERLAEAVDCANDDSTIYDNPDDVLECLRGKRKSEVNLFLLADHGLDELSHILLKRKF
ncbi:hypothetical protein AVEN_275481-1, partial [Araneus ventricosus]